MLRRLIHPMYRLYATQHACLLVPFAVAILLAAIFRGWYDALALRACVLALTVMFFLEVTITWRRFRASYLRPNPVDDDWLRERFIRSAQRRYERARIPRATAKHYAEIGWTAMVTELHPDDWCSGARWAEDDMDTWL